jgi:hypothetical protein
MPTHPLSKRILVAATVAVAALLAAGCGSSSDSATSDTSPTATWADGLCSAITTWTSSISSVGETLKGGDLSKDSLTSAVDDVKSATETFTSDLDGLGKPDTEAGQQAKEAVDQLSTDLKADMTTIQDAVDGASGLSGLIAAAPGIVTTLGTMGTQASSTISSLQSLDAKGELESAFKDAPSCSELAGSG